MPFSHNQSIYGAVQELFDKQDKISSFRARQLLFMVTPLSNVVERYLNANEGQAQKLDKFPMLRSIYDTIPQRLLLKCSRKTLKSTLLSNMITLNMIRYNYYKMLYVGPNEKFTKYFSSTYLAARFSSPAIKKILRGLRKDDVFEKILADTESSVLLAYAADNATRIRGPATDHNIHDEVQDMHFDMLPIIKETMSMSEFKREIFAGTPLTTDNTINILWNRSNRLEWFMKCAGCNHWNSLTEDNEPLKMIMKVGLSCAKCSKVLDSANGQWIEMNPPPKGEKPQLTGYHLAQPVVPHFNQNSKQWGEIYQKVTGGTYSVGQTYNEIFGLAYDLGSKPITEGQLQAVCVLGDMNTLFERNRHKYVDYFLGADWGVNMETSKTSGVLLGRRHDGVLECFFAKNFNDFNYEEHVKILARQSNAVNAFNAADSGPSPDRAIMLADLTSPARTQLVRYDRGKFVQHQEIPKDAVSWRQYRWYLHRTDTITFTLNLIKQKKILFPQWDQVSECLRDILNIYTEVKDNGMVHELFYRRPAALSDDFLHALNYAVIQAYVRCGDLTLSGPSSTFSEPSSLFL